jgi:ferredoxin
MTAAVAIRGCQGCGACLLTCPTHALRPVRVPGGAADLLVLADRCTGCGECVEICPVDAIHFVAEYRVTEERTA